MVSCAEVLSDELRGYSPDTIAILSDESLPYDDCEKLSAWAEVVFG